MGEGVVLRSFPLAIPVTTIGTVPVTTIGNRSYSWI